MNLSPWTQMSQNKPLILCHCSAPLVRYSEIWNETLKIRSSSKRHLFIKSGRKLGCCESRWLRGMEIWTPLSKTWLWSEDQRWLTQALLVLVCEKQLITGTPIRTVLYSLCYFSPTLSGQKKSHPQNDGQAQALPSLQQSFCLKSYSTCFVCLFVTTASFFQGSFFCEREMMTRH